MKVSPLACKRLDPKAPKYKASHHSAVTSVPLSTLTFMLTALTSLPSSQSQYTAKYTFSINDVIGDFSGKTYADDKTILCGTSDAGSPDCALSNATTISEDGVELYPIDSEFGFSVAHFLGAEPKQPRDGIYAEGYVGNIMEGTDVIGIRVSNAATDLYKTPAHYGTWCSGMGGTTVKCSTEHYTVLEHILSCHEAVPYLFADPDGKQAEIELKGGHVDCSDKALDYQAFVVENGTVGNTELNYTHPFSTPLEANDNIDILEDIAVTDDFSVTLKEDGKVLYRWGNSIKRPNDIRLSAKIPLPAEWKTDTANFTVNSAYLVVDHLITNNPNDQLRAEDLENEGAKGRKPSYEVVTVDGEERFISLEECYEGDADLIKVGTVLRNTKFSHKGTEGPIGNVPYTSSDLVGGFTNAYYTTLNRDPFEWSYVNDDVEGVHRFIGYLEPLTKNQADDMDLTLVSGPRWRLRSNKFGQDLPGLEIPKKECSEPPFQKENIKYEVGERVKTWINLLDWDGPSPLAFSPAWVDHEKNDALENVDRNNVTSNALVMTEDFDLAVYIKGDKKATDLYSAVLVIDYEGGTYEKLYNLRMIIHNATEKKCIKFGEENEVAYEIFNYGPSSSPPVKYTLAYSDTKTDHAPMFKGEVESLEAESSRVLSWKFYVPNEPAKNKKYSLKATVVAQLDPEFPDTNEKDDKASIKFFIRKKCFQLRG